MQILASPDLLARRLPPAWAAHRELAAAVGVLLAAQAPGCNRELSADKPASAPAVIIQQAVAPIFRHGEGRGATGCVVVSPPAFLAEEEARQIIEEELEKAGVRISAKDVDFEQVKVPRRYICFVAGEEGRATREQLYESTEDAQSLSVDLLDADKQIAIEYVANTDYGFLGGPIYEAGSWSSVRHYDFIDTALFLREKIQDTSLEIRFGIFYDPLVRPQSFARWKSDDSRSPMTDWMADWNSEEKSNLARQKSARLLREQVKDFVDWLKAQGVI